MASSVEEILRKAKEEEEKYEWLKAADYYQEALNAFADSNFLRARKGEISESLAHVVYKAAFQRDNSSEFKKRMVQAITQYRDAMAIYAESNDAKEAPRILRCEAMIAFAEYWIVTSASEKKKRLEESWRKAVKALEGFEDLAENNDYGRTYNELARCLYILLNMEQNHRILEGTIKQAVELGERAIGRLLTLGDSQKLAQTYTITAILLDNVMNPAEREAQGCLHKVDEYRYKARQLSEPDASLECVASASNWVTELGEESGLKYQAEALELATKTRDRLLIGGAFDCLVTETVAKRAHLDSAEARIELAEKALQYAEEARKNYRTISHSSIGDHWYWPNEPYAWYQWILAREESNLPKKILHLNKALEAAETRLNKAENAGYPRILAHSHGIMGMTLRDIAQTKTNIDSKRELLEEAYKHFAIGARIYEEFRGPYDYDGSGYWLGLLVSIRSSLVDLAPDLETKKMMLQEAANDKEKSLELIFKFCQSWGFSSVLYASLGRGYYEYGELLSRFCVITGDKQCFGKLIEAFEKAVEFYEKPGMWSRVAETHWKIAQALSLLGESEKAANHFETASQNYKKAAEKIPQLMGFYSDLASYMQAWSEIEKGRHHHAGQNYSSARQHFQIAAAIHKSLKQWSYLSSNYLAWAEVEQAEELSKKEEPEEAVKAFEKAADAFVETKNSIQKQLCIIEDIEEKNMATNMIKATDLRHEYCIARSAIEEAKLLDKKGDHNLSSEKYRSAANVLEALGQVLDSEEERKEMKFITSLANAWRKMSEAEAEESPQYYEEASQFFENAKDLCKSETSKALMLGHSRFCKALEAGARFADTRDIAEYARAMQGLESASGYYLKGDFKSASDYVKATRLLFDAYVQMGNAARETDLEKKSRLYMVAEKILQASVDSYAKAGNLSGKLRASKLLDTAKEQRELTVSFAEVLQAPIVTSTTAFTAPAPTFERAVGLDKFEHAVVNANLILSRKELRVGETVDLEIDLANPGKGQAVITYIEEAFPESFDLTTKPESYRVEGHNINLKGRRLDPLKTEEVKLSAKANHRGAFTLRPRILYLDENGNTKFHQPEPVTITVTEIGIRGWIKGEK